MQNGNIECFCGSGKKQKKCHSEIHNDSAIANLYKIYLQIDNEIAANNSSVCNGDCFDCCYGYFFVSEVEFYCILEYIARLYPETLSKIIDKALSQLRLLKERYPSEFKRIEENTPVSRDIMTSARIFDDSAISKYEQCIFLNEQGHCSIYAVRPIICRTFGCYSSITNGCERLSSLSSNLLLKPTANIEMYVDIFPAVNTSVFRRPFPLLYWFGSIYVQYNMNPIFINKGRLYSQINKDQLGTNFLKINHVHS